MEGIRGAQPREYLRQCGVLEGHTGWVTQISTAVRQDYSDGAEVLLTASRDKSLILWDVRRDVSDGKFEQKGMAAKRLNGHSHFVSDCVVSRDGLYALSSSWDKDVRLWDLKTGQCTKRFVAHQKDVLSVAFSADNRQIVSGGRDKTIRLWNTLGECKYCITDQMHNDWVSCVRFSPTNPRIVSCGWDKKVKVWNLNYCKLTADHIGHNGYLTCVTVSPDGSLCASGGKDAKCMLWDLNESKHLYTLESNEINALTFSPNRYWLCAATSKGIKIWDLENKKPIDELVIEQSKSHRGKVEVQIAQQDTDLDGQKPTSKGKVLACTSLAWNQTGDILYGGFTDGTVRCFAICSD